MLKKGSKATTTPSLANISSTTSSIPSSMTDSSQPLPQLIVFDLDYTLWPFWVDTHVTPPIKPTAAHASVTDRFGEDFAFYVDVPSILQTLPQAGIKLGVASRTTAAHLARDLLKALHVPALPEIPGTKAKRAVDVFDAGLEMYPTTKIKHFEALHKRTGVAYEDMLFFDDESRNRDTEQLGVTMWLVTEGVSWDALEKGVAEWRKRRSHRTSR